MAEQVRQIQRLWAVLMLMASRTRDPVWVTIKEAAQLEINLYGKALRGPYEERLTLANTAS
jgi:hypothetical protein